MVSCLCDAQREPLVGKEMNRELWQWWLGLIKRPVCVCVSSVFVFSVRVNNKAVFVFGTFLVNKDNSQINSKISTTPHVALIT